MTIERLYRSLPPDVQRYVASYIPLWQRRGLRRPIKLHPHHSYYTRVRRCPPGMRWNPTYPGIFFYRRQRDTFQWELGLMTPDDPCQERWEVRMYSQWNDKDQKKVLRRLALCGLFYTHAPPAFARLERVAMTVNATSLYICLRDARPEVASPPSRQACAEGLCAYMRELASEVRRREMMPSALLSGHYFFLQKVRCWKTLKGTNIPLPLGPARHRTVFWSACVPSPPP